MSEHLTAEAKASSPTDQAVLRLSAEIDELGHALHGLEARLSPVLIPGDQPSGPTEVRDGFGVSDLVRRLADLGDRVLDLTVHARRISGRLEV